MSGDPGQNRVAERHNHTLMNIVHSMICNTTFSEYLWSETLKIIIHMQIEFLVSLFQKYLMNYGLVENHK
jgi:hypothetical protein